MRLRPSMLIVAFVLCQVLCAQSPSYYFYRTQSPLSSSDLKLVTERFLNADPSASVHHSDDMRILQIKHDGTLDEQIVRSLITDSGIQLLPGTVSPDELGLNNAPADAPPAYVETGDRTADFERYRVSVEAWNAAHPENQMSTTPVHLR